jgi:N-methylhydantoinase A/oxoprolinase/acetone carboxylase beta subunit
VSLRLGIDVGGTNTDAVLVDASGAIVAALKRPTTADVAGGVRAAVTAILDGQPRDEVELAALGTTQCTNAIVERRGLRRVGVLRLGAPATCAIPPLEDWPEDLREVILHDACILPGGHHVDGRTIGAFDDTRVRDVVRRWRGEVEAVAICSVFSPVNADHEHRAAAIVSEELGDLPVSLSSQIGAIGLLERENATVVNAGLTGVAERATAAFRDVLRDAGLQVTPYLSQNDGTLMDLGRARRYPVLTIASGPTNSLRGGAFLSGRRDAIVIDVGGTTADVGALIDGFPRESAIAVDVGGVRTNFRMPDLVAVALGGGTVVHRDATAAVLGPDSVGHLLTEQALAFGGPTTTLTDVAVAAGRLELGTHPDAAARAVDAATIAEVERASRERLESALDRVRTSRDEVSVVVVGGGAFLVPDDLAGAREVIRPEHHEVANAVGAALAEASGTVDRVVDRGAVGRSDALTAARRDARAQAVSAGADPAQLRDIEVEEIALSYLPGDSVRVRVRVAGPIVRHAEGER